MYPRVAVPEYYQMYFQKYQPKQVFCRQEGSPVSAEHLPLANWLVDV